MLDIRRHRIDKKSRKQILEEVEVGAKHFNYVEFGWRDFEKHFHISRTPAVKEFGSWSKSMEALRVSLAEKGIIFNPRPYAPQRIYSDADMFIEMERIWELVGQRPSRNEWESSDCRISYNAYKKRFGSWLNAWIRFVEYKTGTDFQLESFVIAEPADDVSHSEVSDSLPRLRSIPLRTRLFVLERDKFRCVYCGRSPALNHGISLHIDHIQPFSKGGSNDVDNLQTLCNECNLGKGDLYRPERDN